MDKEEKLHGMRKGEDGATLSHGRKVVARCAPQMPLQECFMLMSLRSQWETWRWKVRYLCNLLRLKVEMQLF
jgi:hypothetical protein